MTIVVQNRAEADPKAECDACLQFRVAWAATNVEDLTPLADSEQMLAETHHEEIAALRDENARLIAAAPDLARRLAEAEREGLALYADWVVTIKELEAMAGTHYFEAETESIEAWRRAKRADAAILALEITRASEALPREKPKEVGP